MAVRLLSSTRTIPTAAQLDDCEFEILLYEFKDGLNAYFETGFTIPFDLAEEFTKQFPNVTWDIKQDQFTNLMTATPRLLSGDNPPDLIRLPSMVSLVSDGLLKNLDDYAARRPTETAVVVLEPRDAAEPGA